jgi:hypothetical protein
MLSRTIAVAILVALMALLGAQGLLLKPPRLSKLKRLSRKHSGDRRRLMMESVDDIDRQPPPQSPSFVDNWSKSIKKSMAAGMMLLAMGSPMVPGSAWGDDELAKYAAEGNTVAVDGECFIKKCALETSACANDPNCLKGLSCLARCKGGSMCSTGCFSKYGSKRLDDLLYCSVEKNDCVQVPGKDSNFGWVADTRETLPAAPMSNYDISHLEGAWFKVMGLDSRYDCFDCQQNTFSLSKDKKSLNMDAWFRIPRPSNPGYLQSKISEKLESANTATNPLATLQSSGKMFGLTFWENWYVLGESQVGLKEPTQQNGISSAYADMNEGIQKGGVVDELKLVFYTGHTLQGSYKGAFVYSTSPNMSQQSMRAATRLIYRSGLNPNDFCVIRNTCFVKDDSIPKKPVNLFTAASALKSPPAERRRQLYRMEQAVTGKGGGSGSNSISQDGRDSDGNENEPFWYLGSRFFKATEGIAREMSDWFEDPQILSEWLVQQQEHSIKSMPLAVSPFANLEPFDTYENTHFDDNQAMMGNPLVPGNRDKGRVIMTKKQEASFKREMQEGRGQVVSKGK